MTNTVIQSLHVDQLENISACPEAVRFAAKFPDLQSAWDACERGDWMLWLAGKLSGPAGGEGRKPLVLAACECARLALGYIPAKENRPLIAIETAEKWTRGEATQEEVKAAAAAAAAYAAAYTAAYTATAAAAAAYAAAYTAAYTATDAAYAAANTATDAAYAYAAYAATRTTTLKTCAQIARKYYPLAPTLP